jgi:hypothetical protein
MTTNQVTPIYQLSIHGKLAPKTLEVARAIHNETAGAPASVAAAKSLGDLSHMVYIPADQPGPEAGEFLILDLWNNLEGLNQFFSNHEVQEGGNRIFTERDPVVWAPAEGFFSYHLPAPAGKNGRFIGVVRGLLRSRAEGQTLHNALVGKIVNKARAAGSLSHDAYFRLASPGAPESLEFFAVDVWMSLSGMGELYEDPEFMGGFEGMFAGPPTATVWAHPSGEWVEW